MSNAKHSPTPWEVRENYGGMKNLIFASDGKEVASGWPPTNPEADAAYIVECVNAHERLVEENARLRDLVLRMGDEMEDQKNCLIIASAISGVTRDSESEARVCALLSEARAALGEEVGND